MDEDGEGLRQGDSRETTTASHTWDYGSRSHGGDKIWRDMERRYGYGSGDTERSGWLHDVSDRADDTGQWAGGHT